MDEEGKPKPKGAYEQVRCEGDPNGLFVTDRETGKLVLPLTPNTAYKVEEAVAPDGYRRDPVVREFYLPNADTTTYPMHLPNDTVLPLGQGIIEFPNEKDETEITVVKEWFDADGNDITASTNGDITFELYQLTEEQAEQLNTQLNGARLTIPQWDKSGSLVPVGTKIAVEFLIRESAKNDLALSANSEPIIYTSNPFGLQLPTYVEQCYKVNFTYTVNGNTDITFGQAQYNIMGNVSVEINKPNTGEDPIGTLVGSYSINGSTNNWTWTVADLEKYYNAGTSINPEWKEYRYYVVETFSNPPHSGSPMYVNNDGITSGTITIQNTKDKDNPVYTLPQTGGSSAAQYTIGGLLLVTGAVTAYLLCVRPKRRREAHVVP